MRSQQNDESLELAEDSGSLPDRTFKKDVSAVHSTGMGYLQRKLFNVLLLSAYDDLIEKQVHELPIAVLKTLLKYDSKDYTRLRQALREIRSQPVELNLLSNDGKTPPWTITGLISEATLDGGICTFSFGRKMAEALYNPEIYALINLRIQNLLTSSHTLNLYENCARFRGNGTTGFIPVETWRKLLGAMADGYRDYKRFNRRVLAPAIKECNEKSDLVLTMEEERATAKGRPVMRIRFLVRENEQKTLLPFPADGHGDLREDPVYRELREVGIGERLALMAIKDDPKWALQVVRVVKAEFKRGRLKSPAAYAAKLLRERVELTPRQLELVGEPPSAAGGTSAPQPALTETVSEAAARIKRAFEEDRRKRAMDSLAPGESIEWMKRWAQEMNAEGQGFLLAGCKVEAGLLTGTAGSAFARYVARLKFGEASKEEETRWVARQLSGS